MHPELLTPLHTTLDPDNRLNLPRRFSDHISWMRGTESFRAWLWLVAVGRYRLLSDQQVQEDPQLETVRLLLLEGRSTTVAATSTEDPRRALVVVQLLPVTISPPRSCWSIVLPKILNVLAPNGCDPEAFSILLTMEGHWEVWYTDIVRKTLPHIQDQQ